MLNFTAKENLIQSHSFLMVNFLIIWLKRNGREAKEFDKKVKDIIGKVKWFPMDCDDKVSGVVYMMVITEAGKSYLKDARVLTNDTEANFMLSQMKSQNLLLCK